jgi:hypothetical protein
VAFLRSNCRGGCTGGARTSCEPPRSMPTTTSTSPTSCARRTGRARSSRSIYTLCPVPKPRSPKSYNRHPSPHTLNTTPYTLHPAPCTLHHTPYTLHPPTFIRDVREGPAHRGHIPSPPAVRHMHLHSPLHGGVYPEGLVTCCLSPPFNHKPTYTVLPV